MQRSRDVVALLVLATLAGFVWGLVAAPALRPQSVVAGSDGQVVIQLLDDHTWRYAGGVVATATPDAPHTPSVTPSASPSVTVAPETPRPTTTPTVDVGPTATLESTVIPATVAPTLPPPDDDICMAGIVASVLNVRAEPMQSGAWVKWLYQSDRVQVTELHIIHGEGSPNREEWARIDKGWIAVWFQGVELARLGDSAPCWELPIVYEEDALPATAWGVWAGPGYPHDELAQFGETLKTAGIRPAVTLYGDTSQAAALHAAGWVVIVRPWIGGQDCPSFALPAAISARAWVEMAVQVTAGVPYDWLVLCNEPVFPSAAYGAAWIAAAVDGAAALGVAHLVPVVWPPGHPEIGDVALLAGAYDRSGLCWGMNLYPTVPGAALGDRGGIQEWTVWRWRLYRHLLPDDVGLCVTEFARGDGSEPPDFEDMGRFVEESRDAFEWATAWYAAQPGGLGHWGAANLRGLLGKWAGVVVVG